MQVILLERVAKLGQMGEVVNVKDGYARNFLLPNKKALRSNSANKKLFEANRAKIEADNANRRGDAEGHAKTVAGAKVILIRQASNAGHLYGSVSVRDIVEALHEAGHNVVTKAMVVLERPIKTLGLHDVKVRLHAEVTVTVTLNIARSQDEAERQARGENVINSQFEEDRAADEQAAADMLEGGAGTHVDFERNDS